MKLSDYINRKIIEDIKRDYLEEDLNKNIGSFISCKTPYTDEEMEIMVREIKSWLSPEEFKSYIPDVNYLIVYGENYDTDNAGWTRTAGWMKYEIVDSIEKTIMFKNKMDESGDIDYYHIFPILSEDELWDIV